ncbi:MAG: hypothetical protein V4574_09165 [Pseudomonadota bacterium]
MSIGQELLNVPMGDMIRQMAFAIAEGQIKLDESSIKVAEMMGGLKTVYDDEGNVTFDDSRVFFGFEYMTIEAAKAYLEINHGFTKAQAKAETDKLPTSKDSSDQTLVKVPLRVSMLELGFTPTFYQFIDTIIEVKIAIKITRSTEFSRNTSNTSKSESKRSKASASFWFVGGGVKSGTDSQVSTSQVDAHYAAKYSYSAEGSSLLRTKMAPLPPPPILEERIRNLMELENEARQRQLDKMLPPPPPPSP